jgi:predicted nucleotidyltransferase
MRFSEAQIEFTREFWSAYQGVPHLFGSRVDDNKKGGDIDLLILSDEKMPFGISSLFMHQFFEKFGEQKIDIVCYTNKDSSSFKEVALNNAIRL